MPNTGVPPKTAQYWSSPYRTTATHVCVHTPHYYVQNLRQNARVPKRENLEQYNKE